MKRLILTTIASLMLFCSASTARAEDANDLLKNYEEVIIQDEGVINAFTFYSEEDRVEYLVISRNDQVTIQNNDTGELLHTVYINYIEKKVQRNDSVLNNMNYFINRSSIVQRNNIDNYEKWSSYVYVTERSLYISDFESHTISTIAGLLGGLTGVAASSLVWVATKIHNSKYADVKVKSYNSWNIYCGILVKYRHDYYGNNNSLTSIHQNPTWLTTPWDYANQPAECRILAGRY